MFNGGGVVLRRSGSVHFSRVLMGLAGAVACQHGGLLVGRRGAAVCGTSEDVPFRRGQVRAFGSLQ